MQMLSGINACMVTHFDSGNPSLVIIW